MKRIKPKCYITSCAACGTCDEICPRNAITECGRWRYIQQNKCISCALCVLACPYKAIQN